MNLIREREQRNLKISLNSANAKNLGDSALDSSDSNATDSNDSTPQTSLQNYKKLDYESLSDDEKSEGYVFHILSDFVSNDSRQKLNNLAKELSKIYPCEIEIHIYSNENIKKLPAFATHLTFFRLFIPEILPDTLKSCLYLDIDMLVCGDLRELWTLQLENKAVGIVLDIANTREWVNTNSAYSFDFYFNAGFLLMNLCEFRKLNIAKQCFDFLFQYKPYFADQDALNFTISQEKAIVLPLNFNLFPQAYDKKLDFRFEYTKEQIQKACLSPVILHFAGNAKPWSFENYMDINKVVAVSFRWWQVALQTPFLNNDLIKAQVEKYQAMSAVYNEYKDEYCANNAFSGYIAFLIWQCSKSIWGYIKMPFVIYSAFSAFTIAKSEFYASINPKDLDRALMDKLYFIAKKAWKRELLLVRIAKFTILPLRIRRILRNVR